MKLYKIDNHFMRRPRLHVQFGNEFHIFRSVGALARFLPGEKFGVDKEAVLEIINPQRGSFAKAYRAQMPGGLRPALVGRLDRTRKLVRCDEVVRLEIVDAFIQPIVTVRIASSGPLS